MQIHHRYLLPSLALFMLIGAQLPTMAQGCDSIDSDKQQQNIRRLEKGMLSFGLNFFQTMNRLQEKNDNLCISPFSASMALSMTLNGAEGETLRQMTGTLGFSELAPGEINCAYREIIAALGDAGSDLQFENANSIWIRKTLPVHKEFIATNRTAYNAEVSKLDFDDPEASKTINGWVKKKTKGKINGIVPDKIDPDVMMYLINAIYFKGMWVREFNKDSTKKGEFTLPEGEKIEHDLMSTKGNFAYGMLEDKTQIVELPYKAEKGKFSMIVVLPPEGKEINEYIKHLDESSFSKMLDVLDYNRMDGTLYLPKFKLEHEELLNDALVGMGMGRAFNRDPMGNAEFGKISATPLFISKVRQKTFVEVNEEGTEAAAVTAVEMAYDSYMPPPSFTMRVNRPFFFLIAGSDPDAILFLGKVVDPRSHVK